MLAEQAPTKSGSAKRDGQLWFPTSHARPDEGYSLVDCIAMQTIRKEGLTEILTNDRHFEQEGFRALFRMRQPRSDQTEPERKAAGRLYFVP
jgi:hypothetical protein